MPKSEWAEAVRTRGHCCACGAPLKDSNNINMVNINKYVQWEFPAWGNILARDEDKRGQNRAIAIVCDNCCDPSTGIAKPVKEAIEIVASSIPVGLVEIYYHAVDKLRDADPITVEDIKEPTVIREETK